MTSIYNRGEILTAFEPHKDYDVGTKYAIEAEEPVKAAPIFIQSNEFVPAVT